MSDTPAEAEVQEGGRERKPGRKEEYEEGEVRVLYQNVRRGEDTSHLILQLVVEKKATIVGVAEPWGSEGRRKQQAGYEIAYDSKYLMIHKLRGQEIEVKGEGDWVMGGKEVAIAYLKPEFNWRTVSARLRRMERMGVNTIVGDLNCGRRKRQKLEDWMESEEM